MFDLFSAKCPVETYEKAWTESRMRWLADQFGIDRMLRAQVVVPTGEFFPEPFEHSFESVRRLMDRLCGYMAIDSATLGLEICDDDQLPGAAGHYDPNGQTTIRIAESQLHDPERLVATLVHELSHEILLGGGLLKRTIADHEWITDLLPVFLGIGIFGANATVRHEVKQVGGGYRWKIGKQGYLTSRVFGYAFALFAFMREEDEPDWASHLRPDARTPFREGMRFLRKSEDCFFHPNTIRLNRERLSTDQLAFRLKSVSPTVRLSSLWEFKERSECGPSIVTAVATCLDDRDPAISSAAAETLATFGSAASSAGPRLIGALSDHRDQMRISAVRALGALRCDPNNVVPELVALLDDPNSKVAVEAALALGQFGESASPSIRRILTVMQIALNRCNHALVDALAHAMVSIAADPTREIRDFLESDPVLFQLALSALEAPTRSRGKGTPRKETTGGESIA